MHQETKWNSQCFIYSHLGEVHVYRTPAALVSLQSANKIELLSPCFTLVTNSTGQVLGVENLMVIHMLEKSPTFMVKPSVNKVRSWNVSCVSLINSTPCKIHFPFLPSNLKSSLFPSDFLENMLNVFVISHFHGTCPPQIILEGCLTVHLPREIK